MLYKYSYTLLEYCMRHEDVLENVKNSDNQ